MDLLLLLLFALFAAVHLYHSWKDDAQKRRLTKPFPLLLLAGFYAVSARDISWALLLALLTSWLGDVLLMPRGHKWFLIGGISFLASHFLFIAVYVPDLSPELVPWTLLAVLAPVYIGVSLVTIRAVRPTTPKLMVLPMYLYLLANSTMNLFALSRLYAMKTPGSAVAFTGAVLFFFSDCILFLVRYYRKPEVVFKKHFSVMLAYLTGEMLITVGMLMH